MSHWLIASRGLPSGNRPVSPFREGLNTKNTKQKRCPRMCTARKALVAKARNTKNTKDTEKS